MSEAEERRVEVDPETGTVSALWLRPQDAAAVFVFAHGAGAGMQHAFMEAAAAELARNRIATLRYQFPYMEAGKRRIDGRPRLLQAVRSAVAEGAALAEGLPVFAGGKSMGGRMTSQAAAEKEMPGLAGIVFFGFPLHPAGKPATERADHLEAVSLPLCFLQGTRDKLAEWELLVPVVERLGARAELHRIEGADHGFSVLKRSGRTDDEVLVEICGHAADFMTASHTP